MSITVRSVLRDRLQNQWYCMNQHWMNFQKIFSKPNLHDLENPDLTLGIEDFDIDLDLIMQHYQQRLPQC